MTTGADTLVAVNLACLDELVNKYLLEDIVLTGRVLTLGEAVIMASR